MFVTTFYSYKGGVGRTSALVNVAYRLARKGKRVFILDFDLEAPGVDSYGLTGSSELGEGLVEYIARFMRTGQVPALREFVVDCSYEGTSGKLFVMPAGRKDESYKSALSGLDWKLLYRQKQGYLLIENLKSAIQEEFKPEYLLVDSRTGLTDISGICTLQLPQLVVLLFSLNQQNIGGIAPILKAIKGNKLGKHISTLLVASPVPDIPQWIEARSARFEHARKTMDAAVDLVVPYDPFLAFKESIVDGRDSAEPQSHLGKVYDALTDKIISSNPTDVLNILRDAAQMKEEGHYELAELRYRQAVDVRPESAEGWVEFGKFEKLQRKFREAGELFEKAHSLSPEDPEVLSQLATTFARIDKAKSATYYTEFLAREMDAQRIVRTSISVRDSGLAELSLEGFLRATQLDQQSEAAHFQFGETAMRLGRYREAAYAYQKALELDPNALSNIFNLAMALTKSGNKLGLKYFARAVEIWEKSDLSEMDPEEAANYCEAISCAYLALGRLDVASTMLERALDFSRRVKRGRIFSSSQYRWLLPERFAADISARLEKLRQRTPQVRRLEDQASET